jgi:hypothetical protein
LAAAVWGWLGARVRVLCVCWLCDKRSLGRGSGLFAAALFAGCLLLALLQELPPLLVCSGALDWGCVATHTAPVHAESASLVGCHQQVRQWCCGVHSLVCAAAVLCVLAVSL